ncbi:MAG: hypothetical protein JXM70_27835 [Pirellulales bacterium]|nr:hypothetical protein [Pirellulales bacterium]
MNNSRCKLVQPCVLLPLALATICLLPSPRAAGSDYTKLKKLVLYPAAAPRPALKYQLLPTPLERKPGNAAVFYGKTKCEQNSFFCNKELQNKLMDYLDAPLQELRDAKEIGFLPSVLRHVKRGVLCEDCDWQIPIREDGFATLLPELQESRQCARYLRLIARKQIAQGKFDEAAETLKWGYAFGRHVGDSPVIVGGLVGNAIIGIMSDTLEEYIQQPGAPNLYWALTYLPHPIFDLRQGMEGEIVAINATFPDLFNADETVEDPGYWRHKYWKTVETLDQVTDLWGETNEKEIPVMQFARILRSYPIAKHALVERGMTSQEVDALPVGRAVLMATARIFEEMQDEAWKGYFLPYWEAKSIMDRAENNLVRIALRQEEPLPVASALLPATRAARTAFTRLEQRIAFLRVIEALRLYGAANGGRLPERLADVTEVPVPFDPVTGKPFTYKLLGDKCYLEAAPLPGYQLRYEISFGTNTPKK